MTLEVTCWEWPMSTSFLRSSLDRFLLQGRGQVWANRGQVMDVGEG